MSRLKSGLFWALPTLFFLWVYWYGLRAWFQQDDFAWLVQRNSIHNWHDLFSALFEPRAQGTIRPWSERLFFILFYDRFGLDPRPYHLLVALTQIANLFLLQSITLRLSQSRLVALLTPMIWVANVGLATPISWLSAYNEVLCAFFLLLAFWLLIRGHFVWQVAVFVLGFGALELNVVYPALATTWCWLYQRDRLKRTMWLFSVSALYALVHFRLAPNPKTGLYAQHWDLSIIDTYVRYWGTALAAGLNPARFHRLPESFWTVNAWILAGILTVFGIWAWRRGEKLPAFGFAWFSVAIAPVLSLRDHFTDYYLAIPSIGLALILACLAHSAWRSNRLVWRLGAVAVLGAHLSFALPINRQITMWRYDRGHRIRALVEGLERAHELHPDKILLVSGIDSDLFWSGFFDQPFHLFGVSDVYILPGGLQAIDAHPELGDLIQFVASPGFVGRVVSKGHAAVYSFEDTVLRNITRKYARQLPREWLTLRPKEVNAGLPDFANDLGEGWFPADLSWRWMGRSAEVYISGPERASERLYVAGYCPKEHLKTPLGLSVKVDGLPVGDASITAANDSFECGFDLPPAVVGRPQITVRIEVTRTIREPENGRELGVVFGRIGTR
ncbi:hypothetical protein [uncultured Paludibaculum sp.]|uniref:hypothetical protein n=1 Tax=uncultured Paludibaculum sp. TaxID=1765020 RepID=UPI002AAADBA4|nr:hypothetical protein [uncultured Paludibaculum sp.]